MTSGPLSQEENRLLVVVPHERPHGITRSLKSLHAVAKGLEMRAIKDTMALIAHIIESIDGT